MPLSSGHWEKDNFIEVLRAVPAELGGRLLHALLVMPQGIAH